MYNIYLLQYLRLYECWKSDRIPENIYNCKHELLLAAAGKCVTILRWIMNTKAG